MKTTLDLDDKLMRLAKQQAAKRGITLTQLMEESLRSALIQRPAPATAAFKLELLVKDGRQVGGVDIDDRDLLLERMGGRA